MRRLLLAAALGSVLLACTGGGSPAGRADPTPEVATATSVTADGLVGPLCPVLPEDDDPGNPTFLRDLPLDEALTWNPVLTVFEALGRASGVDADLAAAQDLTVLAFSDDTVNAILNEATLDALILSRPDETRSLLEAHLVRGAMTLEELADAGEVTTLAGTTVTASRDDGATVFDGSVGVLCGDYVTAGGTIHVIDDLLGPLPEQEPEDETHGEHA